MANSLLRQHEEILGDDYERLPFDSELHQCVTDLVVQELTETLETDQTQTAGNGNCILSITDVHSTYLFHPVGPFRNVLALSVWSKDGLDEVSKQELSKLPIESITFAEGRERTVVVSTSSYLYIYCLQTRPLALHTLDILQVKGKITSVCIAPREPFDVVATASGRRGRLAIWLADTRRAEVLRSDHFWVAACFVSSQVFCCTPDQLFVYRLAEAEDDPELALDFAMTYGEAVALLAPRQPPFRFLFFLLTRTYLLLLDERSVQTPVLVWALPYELSRRCFMKVVPLADQFCIFVVDKTNSEVLLFPVDLSPPYPRGSTLPPFCLDCPFLSTQLPPLLLNPLSGFTVAQEEGELQVLFLAETGDLWAQTYTLAAPPRGRLQIYQAPVTHELMQRNLQPYNPAWVRKGKIFNTSKLLQRLGEVPPASFSYETMKGYFRRAVAALPQVYAEHGLAMEPIIEMRKYFLQHPSRLQLTVSGQLGWCSHKRQRESEFRFYNTRVSCHLDRGPILINLSRKYTKLRCQNLLTGTKTSVRVEKLADDPAFLRRLEMEKKLGALPAPAYLRGNPIARLWGQRGWVTAEDQARLLATHLPYFTAPHPVLQVNVGKILPVLKPRVTPLQPEHILHALQAPKTLFELQVDLNRRYLVQNADVLRMLNELVDSGRLKRFQTKLPSTTTPDLDLVTVYITPLSSKPTAVPSQATQEPVEMDDSPASALMERWEAARARLQDPVAETPRRVPATPVMSAPTLRMHTPKSRPEEVSTPLQAPRLSVTPKLPPKSGRRFKI